MMQLCGIGVFGLYFGLFLIYIMVFLGIYLRDHIKIRKNVKVLTLIHRISLNFLENKQKIKYKERSKTNSKSLCERKSLDLTKYFGKTLKSDFMRKKKDDSIIPKKSLQDKLNYYMTPYNTSLIYK
jgi:hypothetical protein